jgi:DNA-binding GntR family transcriptional regulator
MSILNAPVEPIRVANLREQARARIRAMVITGELEPERVYTVGTFATMLGVSATPVREALGDLEQVGLVKILRNRGFIVPRPTEDDLDEIFQIRQILESGAIGEVTGRISDDDIAACRELVERCKQAAAAGDLAGFLEADLDFHLRLIGALGNRRLLDTLRELRDHTRLYGLRELASSGRLIPSAEEHEVLLDLVARGDADGAKRQIEKHLRHTRGAWAGRDEAAS